jgi:hypothetical protein
MMFIKRGSMAGQYRDWQFPYPLVDGTEEFVRVLPTAFVEVPTVEPTTQQIAIMFGQPQKLDRLTGLLHSVSHLADGMEMRIRGDILEVGFNTSLPHGPKFPWDMIEAMITGSFCLDIRP